jgi:hypothetical protein
MEPVKYHQTAHVNKPTVNGGAKYNDIKSATAAATDAGGDGVRRVTLSEYKQAAACLAEAFAQDDVARYFIEVPDRADWTPEQKWDLHVSILEYVTYAHILKGLVLAAGPDYGCVALW